MTSTYAVKPLSPLRKMIANRMMLAKTTIPHYRLSVDIEMDALMALRDSLNQRADLDQSVAVKLSLNDFLIKAAASALMAEPALNIQYVDGEIHQYQQANITVITAIDGGVTTPVIFSAERKNVVEVAQEVRQLVKKAHSGQLKMQQISGGTFSLSNLGMFGVDQFDAIVNPPEVGMLALASAKSMVCAKKGKAHVATVMRVSLSLDHRLIDGAQGAAFIGVFKQLIEQADPDIFC